MNSASARAPNFHTGDGSANYSDRGYVVGLFDADFGRFDYGLATEYLLRASINLTNSPQIASYGHPNPRLMGVEWGDFNNDGRDELVIGVPTLKGIGQGAETGGFVVLSLADNGAITGAYTVITDQAQAQNGPRWGGTLAVGDYNGDGYEDLVVGSGTSFFKVFWGSSTGLSSSTLMGSNGTPIETVAGDFNCDGYEDLAIGWPSAGTGGMVKLYQGTPSGLQTNNAWQLKQAGSQDEANDSFVGALAAGNFNGNLANGRPCVDLAVGIPGETVNGDDHAGSIWVFGGGSGFFTIIGLSPSSSLQLHQDTSGVGGSAEPWDSFGRELAVSDLNVDGYDDLVVHIGAEYWNADCNYYSAALQVFAGSSTGVTTTNYLINVGGGPLGNVGGAEKGKITAAVWSYEFPSCPAESLKTYTFAQGAGLTLTNTTTTANVEVPILTRAHPGFVR